MRIQSISPSQSFNGLMHFKNQKLLVNTEYVQHMQEHSEPVTRTKIHLKDGTVLDINMPLKAVLSAYRCAARSHDTIEDASLHMPIRLGK